MQFPEGDTLGVVFSFLTAFQLLGGSLFRVCKEWNRVLCQLPMSSYYGCFFGVYFIATAEISQFNAHKSNMATFSINEFPVEFPVEFT